MNDADPYVAAVLGEYRDLPGTSGRLGPADRRFARSLYDRRIPLDVVRGALLLATARRLVRAGHECSTLPLVRSLAYFRHTIDELVAAPLDPAYFSFVRRTLQNARTAASSHPDQA